MFDNVLVASRGEIGARLARTLRRLGADTVAVCVAGEEASVHVQACDSYVVLPPVAGGADPHRDVPSIVRAARQADCRAVHAGYGLFDERVELPRSLERAGIGWIGPDPSLVVACRDRALMRAAASDLGLRVLPCSAVLWPSAEPSFADEARREVEALALPLAVRTAFRSDERGTVCVLATVADVESWLADRSAASEAEPVVFERHVERARHVEVWLVSDGKEAVVVGDVECSVRKDRRRVVAESPAPAIDVLHHARAVRATVWQAAVDVAREFAIRGVAAVRWVFDAAGCFYFAGVRLGLAPEHALVEMCCSIDLVEVECALALGGPLPKEARRAEPTGHAVQARVEAALDPRDGRPFPGRTDEVRWPPAPTGRVRIEASVQPGSRVAPHHDPLVASVTTYAPTRHEAVLALDRVVAETRIAPLVTNLRLIRRALNHESFRALTVDEGFLDRA